MMITIVSIHDIVLETICDSLVNFSGGSHISYMASCTPWIAGKIWKNVFTVNWGLVSDETKRLKTLDGETSTVYDQHQILKIKFKHDEQCDFMFISF